MRDDIPEWLGKPPLRGTDEWTAWLEKWRNYARAELRDTAADDPDFDFGLLTTEERWRVILKLEIQRQIAQGIAGDRAPIPSVRRISDLAHAGVVAWLVSRRSARTFLKINTTNCFTRRDARPPQHWL